jgi:DNA-binding IclR family transcriptional regulator
VERALAILAAFADGAQALTLGELARATGLYKSTILRLIASLERHGYVRRLPDGRYAVGPEPLRLARAYQASFRLADAVVPVLERLAERSGETASFYVREADERVCLHRVEANRVVRVSVHEGDRFPLDRGASGRVLLAFGGGPGRALDEVRRGFCALSTGERDPETAAVACPVFGPGNTLLGALNVSGPRVRLTEARQRQLKSMLLAEAIALSNALGAEKGFFNPTAAA